MIQLVSQHSSVEDEQAGDSPYEDDEPDMVATSSPLKAYRGGDGFRPKGGILNQQHLLEE